MKCSLDKQKLRQKEYSTKCHSQKCLVSVKITDHKLLIRGEYSHKFSGFYTSYVILNFVTTIILFEDLTQ